MSGRLLLTLEGIKDLVIEGSPSITFFKSIYKKYTPFSFEQVELIFDGALNESSSISFDVPKNADLLHRCYLHFNFSDKEKTEELPTNIFELFTRIEFTVDGKIIDTISSWHLYTHYQKSSTPEQWKTLKKMTFSTNPVEFMIPLTFFFCTSPSNALPLLAIQDSQLTFRLHLSSQNSTINNMYESISPSIWVEYIHLSKEESDRFIKDERKMLITQHQDIQPEKIESKNQKIKLNFKHYVKEIYWFIYQHTQEIIINDGLITDQNNDFTLSKDVNFESLEFLIGGSPIYEGRNKMFYTLLNYYNYYKRNPDDNFYLFSYSFALDPNMYQPNGIINFNTLNKYEFHFHNLTLDDNLFIVFFAKSYNFFQIKNKRGIISLL